MPILLITATGLEAEPIRNKYNWKRQPCRLAELYKLDGIFLAHLGLGKTNTAAALSLLIDKYKPEYVVQYGIGGMYPNSNLELAEVVVADSETDIDSGLKTDKGFGMQELGFPLLKKEKDYYNLFPVSQELKEKFTSLGLEPKAFATSETITGNFADAILIEKAFKTAVESMEGVAAAQTCLALDTPFIELRAISNVVGERDKNNWKTVEAVQKVNDVIISFLKSNKT